MISSDLRFVGNLRNSLPEGDYFKLIATLQSKWEAASEFPAFHFHPALSQVVEIVRDLVRSPLLSSMEVMMSNLPGSCTATPHDWAALRLTDRGRGNQMG